MAQLVGKLPAMEIPVSPFLKVKPNYSDELPGTLVHASATDLNLHDGDEARSSDSRDLQPSAKPLTMKVNPSAKPSTTKVKTKPSIS